MNFYEKLDAAVEQNNSLLCVGLDPSPEKIPPSAENIVLFNKQIIDSTKDLVCAFKPNSAFYEASGPSDLQALKETIDYIKVKAPSIPIIFDFKRADIGNTNLGYVSFSFDYLKADAVTVHPYMGRESLTPFLEQENKGIFVLCRTSNPGAGEFQDLKVDASGKKLYHAVAENVANDWNTNGNCALVVGATYPDELAEVRRIVGDGMLILVPGVGAQGGDVEKTVRAGTNSKGKGIIVNSSRGIIYASDGKDYAEAARQAAMHLRDEINRYRK